jgi:hypothetical protein
MDVKNRINLYLFIKGPTFYPTTWVNALYIILILSHALCALVLVTGPTSDTLFKASLKIGYKENTTMPFACRKVFEAG